jgi:hypothetical protein
MMDKSLSSEVFSFRPLAGYNEATEGEDGVSEYESCELPSIDSIELETESEPLSDFDEREI